MGGWGLGCMVFVNMDSSITDSPFLEFQIGRVSWTEPLIFRKKSKTLKPEVGRDLRLSLQRLDSWIGFLSLAPILLFFFFWAESLDPSQH